jgi:hypothetical protein
MDALLESLAPALSFFFYVYGTVLAIGVIGSVVGIVLFVKSTRGRW